VKPLCRTSESEYEQRLLRSARSESPDADALGNLLGFLEDASARGLDPVRLDDRTGVAARASARGWWARWREWLFPSPLPAPAWALAGLVVGLVGGATFTALWLRPTQPPSVTLEPERAPNRAALPAGTPSVASPPSASAAASASLPEMGRVRSTLPADARSSSRPAPGIASEVELVEGARKAVESGDTRQALDALDQHDRRFESGPLAHEAKVLRIQALLAARDYAAAEAAAHGFLASQADSPYANRVRTLLREAEQRRAAEASPPDARP
jgi:hypothetical protein